MHATIATTLTPDGWSEIALRIGAAMALGALCGWDRERGGKAAGLRTYMMVSLGAATFTIVGLELIDSLRAEDDSIRYDPSRIVAGIVTGIGFLGAGTIMRSGQNVHGLTTAARRNIPDPHAMPTP
ncbi:MAG: MgtC/SapB family protein, partial [Phycisphaerales bacterium]|nr:MgtC/SapB family protein [Phycisphaerales bacterium]